MTMYGVNTPRSLIEPNPRYTRKSNTKAYSSSLSSSQWFPAFYNETIHCVLIRCQRERERKLAVVLCSTWHGGLAINIPYFDIQKFKLQTFVLARGLSRDKNATFLLLRTFQGIFVDSANLVLYILERQLIAGLYWTKHVFARKKLVEDL